MEQSGSEQSPDCIPPSAVHPEREEGGGGGEAGAGRPRGHPEGGLLQPRLPGPLQEHSRAAELLKEEEEAGVHRSGPDPRNPGPQTQTGTWDWGFNSKGNYFLFLHWERLLFVDWIY